MLVQVGLLHWQGDESACNWASAGMPHSEGQGGFETDPGDSRWQSHRTGKVFIALAAAK